VPAHQPGAMTGASTSTRRITHVNANWTPGEEGDGRFTFLLVTEDGERRTVDASAADATALTAMIRADVVLLWDPEGRTVIIGNLLGCWIPLDWTAAG